MVLGVSLVVDLCKGASKNFLAMARIAGYLDKNIKKLILSSHFKLQSSSCSLTCINIADMHS